jgi:hypothetical protein
MIYRRVIIESPFRGLTRRLAQKNVNYAVAAMKDSINRGEAPFLSHMLYPAALDDAIAVERILGIELGYAWWTAAEAICCYCDLGWSLGMVEATLRAKALHIPIEERYLAKDKDRNS